MDFKKLIVGFVYYSESKKKVLLSGTFGEDEQIRSAKMSKGFFVDAFKDKTLKITGNDYVILAKILSVQVSSNIIDFKNIDFLTDLKEIGKIKLNDIIEVID